MNIEMDQKDQKIEDLERHLFNRWIDEELFKDQLCPPINAVNLIDDFNVSRQTGKSVDFLAVGCQQFSEVSDEDGNAVNIPSSMNIDVTHRFGRFVNEISSLFNSLGSFGVSARLAITFSDAESFLTKGLHGKMFREMNIEELVKENDRKFLDKMRESNIKTVVFSHVDALTKQLCVESFDDLVDVFFQKEEKPTVEKFLDRLYHSDPENLPPVVIREIFSKGEELSLDLVWLDLMSPLAGDHRARLHGSIKKLQPDMPVLAPFHNSGKWETAVEPERIFKNKFEFISSILNISPRKKKESWLRNALSVPDKNMEDFFKSLGLDIEINNPRSKEQAVKILEKLTFGTENFQLVEEVPFTRVDTVKSIIVRKSGWAGSHVFNLIRNGNVKKNGEIISVSQMSDLHDGDLLSVGKLKLVIRSSEQ